MTVIHFQQLEISDHYNIQRDQFGSGRFDSVIPFGVLFGENGSFVGNELRPADMGEEPTFHIGGKADQLFTVVITSLDSNPVEGRAWQRNKSFEPLDSSFCFCVNDPRNKIFEPYLELKNQKATF